MAQGGTVRFVDGGTLAIYNAVIWSNGGPGTIAIDISSNAAATADILSSNLEGGIAAMGWIGGIGQSVVSSNVIGADPLVRDLLGPDGDSLTVADNDYRRLAGSPSVDAGSNPLLAFDLADTNGNGVMGERVTRDLDGRPRRNDDPATVDTGVGMFPIADHGAYER